MKLSVVIRNKNQDVALGFLLKNLNERYNEDIDEIIVIDNLSNDKSIEISKKYGAKIVAIKKFSYGASANLAAKSASNEIVVIFSAHAFPVSHDFFKLIIERFRENSNLAGLRCLHNKRDYHLYINKDNINDNPNNGVIFCGSAFSRKVWEAHNFKGDIRTMEDKEWSKRVIDEGYDIEFVPSIFCYDIKRNSKQLFFRFKNEHIGGYQLWQNDYSLILAIEQFLKSIISLNINFLKDMFYTFKKFFFKLSFLLNKPKRY